MNSAIAKAVIFTVPFLLLLGVLACWNPRVFIWVGVEPPKAQVEAYDVAKLRSASSLDSSIYDSAKLRRLFREPQNTVSNLAFVIVGLAVGFAGRRRLTLSFAIACIFLGIGSGLYHASLLSEWRLVDIMGVYVVLFSLIGIGFASTRRSPTHEFWLTTTIWIVAFYTGIRRNDVRIAGFKVFDSTYVVIGSVILLGGLCLWSYYWTKNAPRYWRTAGVLVFVSLLAVFGGLADRFGGLWANPNAWLQGHAVWHTFGAIALLAAYEVFCLTGYDTSVFSTQTESRPGLQTVVGSVATDRS